MSIPNSFVIGRDMATTHNLCFGDSQAEMGENKVCDEQQIPDSRDLMCIVNSAMLYYPIWNATYGLYSIVTDR